MELWSEDVIKFTGNKLETYLHYDKSYREIGNMAYARVLLNSDTREAMVANSN